MAPLFKIVFDLSVYYTLMGYYLNIIFERSAALTPMLLLALSVGLYKLARSFRWRRFLFPQERPECLHSQD